MARRILLADDSVTAQNMGRRILTDAGYEVVTVNNGSAALKRIAEQKPDLIVLDVYMPGYGGLEVCQRLKETRETARIPVLLTVGKLEPFKPEEARRARADAYIVKPFEASELLTALTKLEDKIVPSGDYKPGRFAKAIAAVEFEESDRFGDSETGWKERLIMPAPGAKSKQQEPEIPPAVGTAKSQDLGRGADFKPAELKSEFERPIPAGLPADITPEEIAAITAAAAAFGGKSEAPAASPAAPAAETPEAKSEPTASTESARPDTTTPVENTEEAPAATFASAPEVPPAVESATTTAPAEAQPATEAVASSSSPAPETQPQAEVVAASANPAIEEPVAAVPAAAIPEIDSAVKSVPVADPLEFEKKRAMADPEVVAALASLGIPANGDASAVAAHSSSLAVASAAASAEPTAGEARASGPRWIGEEVALTEDESALILEREMEKAYAAMAAGEVATVSFAAPSVAVETPAAVAVAAPERESSVVESVPAIQGIPETGAVEAAVSADEPAAGKDIDAVAATPQSAIQESVAQTNETLLAAISDIAASAATEEVAYAAAAAAGGGTSETVAAPEPAPSPTTAPATSGPPALDESNRKKESELAAAWANWKQVREAIVDSQLAAKVADVAAAELKDTQRAESSTARPEDETEAPAPPPAADPSAIASIVDSVLAELKPKLVEEIARKMGSEGEKKRKKKKD